MRKIILFNLVTLDGYFEGLNADLSWHKVDDEFKEFAIAQMKTADTLLFGRKTYEHMAGYWPREEAIKNDPVIAEMMNNFDKIVFSETLENAAWNNTKLIKENFVEEVQKIKSNGAKNVLIFGSATFSSTLIKHDLIDELRVMINPVILGKGIPLFKNIEKKIALQLIKTKVFGNGSVLLSYILNN